MNKRNLKHGGFIGGKPIPEYNSWSNAFRRCYNPSTPSYKYCGAKGIKMCSRWKYSFKNFLIDMGYKPKLNYSLDRINNDDGYNKINCRWADPKTQSMNRTCCGDNLKCKRGHIRSIENTYITNGKKHECRLCRLELKRVWRKNNG